MLDVSEESTTFMDSFKLEDGGNAFIRNVGNY